MRIYVTTLIKKRQNARFTAFQQQFTKAVWYSVLGGSHNNLSPYGTSLKRDIAPKLT